MLHKVFGDFFVFMANIFSNFKKYIVFIYIDYDYVNKLRKNAQSIADVDWNREQRGDDDEHHRKESTRSVRGTDGIRQDRKPKKDYGKKNTEHSDDMAVPVCPDKIKGSDNSA